MSFANPNEAPFVATRMQSDHSNEEVDRFGFPIAPRPYYIFADNKQDAQHVTRWGEQFELTDTIFTRNGRGEVCIASFSFKHARQMLLAEVSGINCDISRLLVRPPSCKQRRKEIVYSLTCSLYRCLELDRLLSKGREVKLVRGCIIDGGFFRSLYAFQIITKLTAAYGRDACCTDRKVFGNIISVFPTVHLRRLGGREKLRQLIEHGFIVELFREESSEGKGGPRERAPTHVHVLVSLHL